MKSETTPSVAIKKIADGEAIVQVTDGVDVVAVKLNAEQLKLVAYECQRLAVSSRGSNRVKYQIGTNTEKAEVIFEFEMMIQTFGLDVAGVEWLINELTARLQNLKEKVSK